MWDNPRQLNLAANLVVDGDFLACGIFQRAVCKLLQNLYGLGIAALAQLLDRDNFGF